ncbi:hypothetical protein CCACVL1_03908, partial [Corchorus capsularis]
PPEVREKLRMEYEERDLSPEREKGKRIRDRP